MKKIVGIALAIIMCAGTAFAQAKTTTAKSAPAKKTTQSVALSKKIYLELGMGGGGVVMPSSDKSLNDQIRCYGMYATAGMFNIQPTIGFYPINKNENFSLEFSVFMDFGKFEYTYTTSTYNSTTKKYESTTETDSISYNCIMPLISAQYYFTPKEKFSMFTGAGFGVPFQNGKYSIIELGIAGFGVVLNYGAQYKINNNISAYGEVTAGLGSFTGWTLDGGIRYVF